MILGVDCLTTLSASRASFLGLGDGESDSIAFLFSVLSARDTDFNTEFISTGDNCTLATGSLDGDIFLLGLFTEVRDLVLGLFLTRLATGLDSESLRTRFTAGVLRAGIFLGDLLFCGVEQGVLKAVFRVDCFVD